MSCSYGRFSGLRWQPCWFLWLEGQSSIHITDRDTMGAQRGAGKSLECPVPEWC